MISVVIPTFNDAQRLTATLAALAPAAVDGFVREVIIADGGSADETLEIADDAGADVVTTGFADALAAARQPWLLFLVPGGRPQVGWERAAHAHMRDYPDKAGWFDLALAEPGIGARVREVAARSAFGRFRVEQGPLIRRERLEKLGLVKDHRGLAAALSRASSRRLGARVLVGGG